MSCGSQWVALLPPQQHIPSPIPRLGTEAYLVAKQPLLIARCSQPRMTWDAAMSQPLECCTILLICLMSLNELWITMGGLAFTSTTHSKPKARDRSLYGSKTSSGSQALSTKNGMGCSHANAPGVLHIPFDMSNESQ